MLVNLQVVNLTAYVFIKHRSIIAQVEHTPVCICVYVCVCVCMYVSVHACHQGGDANDTSMV